MIGKPKYDINDVVGFDFTDADGNKTHVVGWVYIIDAYGVFENNSDVHYDIMTDGCLYKHVIESLLTKEENKQ